MADKMETFAARLASFDSVLPSINSRTSTSRNIQPIAWPYDSPSPEQLAHAGFFFNPYDTNPDNTTCFLCRRALDGWEEGDNPVTEHLKHSPDCGWAIIMDIQQKTSNPAEIQDPTSVTIVDARRATFAMGWPHDGKPGWVCQSDKMVEAGWYFCPNDESPDLASCPYCKLSLDGWEESDDPFEEHHRRSSDCSFFVFALPAAKPTKKATRSKKPRASKVSRLSTQSVMTTTSEAPTIEDDTMDISVMSQATVKKAKSTKKSTRSKAKKSKKEEPLEVDDLMDPEPVEEKAPEPEKPKRATRGTKRGSEAVTQDLPTMPSTEIDPVPELEEPSPKRRATEIRRSISQQPEDMQPDYPEEPPVDVATSPVMPKKGRKGAKKSTATKARKTSTASSSGRTTKGKIPDDSVLEAAIEADLARNMQESEPFEFHYKDEERESARFRQSILASEEAPTADDDIEEAQDTPMEPEVIEQTSVPEPEAESVPEVSAEPKAKKPSKRKATSKKSKKEKTPTPVEPEPEPEPEYEDAPEPEDVELIHSNSNREQPTQDEVFEPQPQPVEEEELPQESMEVERGSRHGSIIAVEIENNKRHPESDSENMQLPAKKSGKKTASKGKKLNTSKHTEDGPEERNEIADTNSQTAPDAAKTRVNGSKRKAQEVDEAVEQENGISEDPTHEEVVEQPPVKAKRGRPTKDVEEAHEKPVVESKQNNISEASIHEEVIEQPPVKAKRGRPTKDVDEAPQDVKKVVESKRNSISKSLAHEEVVEQPPVKGKRGRPTKDVEEAQEKPVVESTHNNISKAPIHEEVIEQPPVKSKRGRPTKDTEEVPQGEKQATEAKPRRGRPSKQAAQKEDEDEEQTKQARSLKSKAPPKNTQRYSDLPKDRHRAQSFIESVTSSSPARAQEPANPRTQERTPSPSPQSSDAENRPPSTRPRSARPPILSPSKALSTRVPLAASTPTRSPSKRQADTGYLSSTNSWGPMDIDELLGSLHDKENRDFTINQGNLKEILTSPEKKMTVEEWIRFNAKNGEERLRQECERLISIFEREGGKAMRALEGIECID